MKAENIFRMLTDKTRLRILMLLDQRELCVCQIMAVLGVSQPLVSKNLSLLKTVGFLDERRDGKLVFHRISHELPQELSQTMHLLRKLMVSDRDIRKDRADLKECMAFQKKRGTCDMTTFQDYLKQKRRR